MRRVVITGIGAITPIGNGAAGLWEGVRAGRSAVRRITRFDPTPFRSQIAAEVDEGDLAALLDQKRARRLDRCSRFAVIAARQALADAGLGLQTVPPERVGVYVGSALGGVAFAEEQHRRYLAGGVRAVDPTLALIVFSGAGAGNVSIDLGTTGPAIANANSCASGAIAIGEAFQAIRAGCVEVALAGGAEAPLAPLTFGAFAVIRALSTRNDDPARASRPFDVERDGFVMAEGAGILVLEALDHALRRGARPYAEVLGYATTSDGYHMTAPQPDGSSAARAMAEALASAGLGPEAVDYVKAHASSTPLGDRAEAAAIRRVFGPRAERVPVGATKGLHGHALGASGAWEAAICALALRAGWLPGVANLERADPDCQLDLVPPPGRPGQARVVLASSFGFGGTNACLVLGRWEPPANDKQSGRTGGAP